MAQAESLGVVLTLTLREAQYLHALTGKQTGAQANQIVEGGQLLNSTIYATLQDVGIRGYGEEF
jgi:hypothetical protein